MLKLVSASRRTDQGGASQEASLTDKIFKYELPFDAPYLTWKLGWSNAMAEQAIGEYKKFLVLAYTLGVEVTPSQIIDEVWHYHILHTRDYERMGKVFGRVLHHDPGGPPTPGSFGIDYKFKAQYLSTLKRYEETFGAPPPPGFWPRPKQAEAGTIDRLIEVLSGS